MRSLSKDCRMQPPTPSEKNAAKREISFLTSIASTTTAGAVAEKATRASFLMLSVAELAACGNMPSDCPPICSEIAATLQELSVLTDQLSREFAVLTERCGYVSSGKSSTTRQKKNTQIQISLSNPKIKISSSSKNCPSKSLPARE